MDLDPLRQQEGHVGVGSATGHPPRKLHELSRIVIYFLIIPLQGLEYLAVLDPVAREPSSSSPHV